MNAIEVTELTRRFADFTAVDRVTFEVSGGEIFGFLGPNGAGKTTTVKMLCTLLRPNSGRARVVGFDVVRQQDQVRRSVGIIFQDPSLDDRLTARENLRFHGIIYKVPRRELRERLEQSLEWMQLADRADDLVRNFSGGMKRRLEIARGLLHAPQVLFLDEPTLGLDPQTRSRIWNHLLELRDRRRITLFLTTHYMDEAEYCDRIAIIDSGRIVALDTPVRLKAGVRGDVVRLSTEDDARAADEIRTKYGCAVRADADGLQFEVSDGAGFVPRLVRELTPVVRAVSSHPPTLDDVFLKLTGREIRESEASGRERLKAVYRRLGRAMK
jgi:ABC-2 type transport system ATP-binding protein